MSSLKPSTQFYAMGSLDHQITTNLRWPCGNHSTQMLTPTHLRNLSECPRAQRHGHHPYQMESISQSQTLNIFGRLLRIHWSCQCTVVNRWWRVPITKGDCESGLKFSFKWVHYINLLFFSFEETRWRSLSCMVFQGWREIIPSEKWRWFSSTLRLKAAL